MANLISITNFDDPALDIYARRTEVQLLNREHPADGMFIAESPKVITRALDAGCIPVSVLTQDRLSPEAAALLPRLEQLPIYTAPFAVLTKLTGFQLTRGMLCAMQRPPLPTAEALCQTARRVAVLDRVMNPTNVGAIFRSAAALGMDAVLLTADCSDPLYRRAIRVSMGTVFQIPWGYVQADYISQLRTMGFQTAAMALRHDTVSVREPALQQIEKLAIVLGSEGDGLPETTLDRCDYTIKIPMLHGVDSLNVAAASAVAFWQLGNAYDCF